MYYIIITLFLYANSLVSSQNSEESKLPPLTFSEIKESFFEEVKKSRYKNIGLSLASGILSLGIMRLLNKNYPITKNQALTFFVPSFFLPLTLKATAYYYYGKKSQLTNSLLFSQIYLDVLRKRETKQEEERIEIAKREERERVIKRETKEMEAVERAIEEIKERKRAIERETKAIEEIERETKAIEEMEAVERAIEEIKERKRAIERETKAIEEIERETKAIEEIEERKRVIEIARKEIEERERVIERARERAKVREIFNPRRIFFK